MPQLIFDGNAVCYLTGSAAALSVTTRALEGNARCYLTGSAGGLRVSRALVGASVCQLAASPNNLRLTYSLGMLAGNIACGASAVVRVPRAGLTVWDAALEVYGLFRIEVRSPLDLTLARPRILSAINSIMQQIWAKADRLNFFNQEVLSFTVADGDSTKELDDNVQQVIGPVSVVGGKDLRPLPSAEDLRSYVDYWHGGTQPSYNPTAYYLNSQQDTAQPDRTKITIELPWAVSGNYNLEADVVMSVPRYTEADIREATPIRLPAAYVELLFLPLLREWASTDHLFKSETARPAIAQAAQMAREALGMVAPDPSIVRKLAGEGVTP